MSSMITCHGCQGRKQVSPLGGIPKNCAICEGIGWLTYQSIPCTNTQPITNTSVSTHEDILIKPNESINPIGDEIKAKLSKKKPGKRALIKKKLDQGKML